MPRRPRRMLACVRLCLLIILAPVVGCGGNPATVTGVVSLDGQPLNTGTVGFSPVSGGMKAVGIIQSDGRYELTTNREAGVQVGEFKVVVIALEPGEVAAHGGPPRPGKNITPKRYGSASTSGLKFNVEKGGNVIDIELSSAGLEEDANP